jgi:hypothetical protein
MEDILATCYNHISLHKNYNILLLLVSFVIITIITKAIAFKMFCIILVVMFLCPWLFKKVNNKYFSQFSLVLSLLKIRLFVLSPSCFSYFNVVLYYSPFASYELFQKRLKIHNTEEGTQNFMTKFSSRYTTYP